MRNIWVSDSINIFINNNIGITVFILFLLVVYSLKNTVIRLIDEILTIKNLKVILFIILVLMVFIVLNTFYKFISIETTLVAPYMIAMSALLASIVAVINIINNNIKNIIDRSEKVTALTHSGAVKINFFLEKSKSLKLMLVGKSKILYDFLIECEIMLREILNFLNRDDLHKFKSYDIFYEVHNDLIIFLPVLKKLIRNIDKDPEKCYGKYIKVFENAESYEKLIENLEKLIIVLEEIKIAETKEHKKLYDEQQER